MAINAKRLLKLADYLETVPREQFDMSLYGWGSETQTECGFAGCAIGWAIHGKLFRGFTFDKGHQPSYQGYYWYGAIDKLFDLSDGDVSNLFGPHNSGTPKQVAKRIRKFVRDNQASAS